MVNPVPGAKITARYRQPGPRWSLGFHTGTDFAAPVGTTIRSMTNGRVIAANAYDPSYGFKVIIEYKGYEYWYCHMPANRATVKVVQYVEAGERIGVVGMTGNTSGPHTHIEKRIRGGGFKESSFRDPTSDYGFVPASFRVQTFNLAYDNSTGLRTASARRNQILTEVLLPDAEVSLFQEMPMSKGADWFKNNVRKTVRGKQQGQRQIFGASGRYAWGSKNVQLLSKGVIKVRSKPATWGLVRIDTYRKRLIVNIHGPARVSSSVRQSYYKAVWAAINKLRARFGLEWWQVIVGGDTNGPKEFYQAAKPYGHVPAYGRAKKYVNKRHASTNQWKPRRRVGYPIDVFTVHTSVTVLELRNRTSPAIRTKKTQAISDHQRQVLILR